MKPIYHTFAPVYNEDSEVLILGTFPSVKSREEGFYYGHKQNRFWKIMAALLKEEVPITIEEKKILLLRNKIAVWDVIESCEIMASSDASIRNVKPNDLSIVLQNSGVRRIYTNGSKAKQLYDKYQYSQSGIEAKLLPSTSPANASYSFDKLLKAWKQITGEE